MLKAIKTTFGHHHEPTKPQETNTKKPNNKDLSPAESKVIREKLDKAVRTAIEIAEHTKEAERAGKAAEAHKEKAIQHFKNADAAQEKIDATKAEKAKVDKELQQLEDEEAQLLAMLAIDEAAKEILKDKK